MKAKSKTGRLENFFHHFREFLGNFVYLFICLSVLETYRSLLLLQFGLNEFSKGYIIALCSSLIMGKFVVLAQFLPFFNSFRKYSLFVDSIYKSLLMTCIVLLFRWLEEIFFSRSHVDPSSVGENALLINVTHFLCGIFVFFVLFSVRGLESSLGPGRLHEIFFGARSQASTESHNESQIEN